MGYFSEMDIERSCLSNDHSYTDPVFLLGERIEELKNWLRWYGCELVDTDDFECICSGYIFEDQIHEYIPPETIRYQADALRELGWSYHKLKLLEENGEGSRDVDASETTMRPVHQLTAYGEPKWVRYYSEKAA